MTSFCPVMGQRNSESLSHKDPTVGCTEFICDMHPGCSENEDPRKP